MRKLVIGGLVLVAALAVAAIAAAATQTTYTQRFLSNRTSTPTGTHLAATAVDPDNKNAGGQPAPPRELDISFPTGTTINQSAAPVCGSFDPSLADPCPPNTRVGSGTAELLEKFPGSDPITADVTVYNRKSGLWLFVVPQVSAQDPFLVTADLKGLTLAAKIPQQCALYDCQRNGEAALSSLTLDLNKIRSGSKVYLTTPRGCGTSGWRFKATFRFDAPTPAQTTTKLQKCRK
jgi:hypothetical protein